MEIARKGLESAVVLLELEAESIRLLLVGRRVEAKTYTPETFDPSVIPSQIRKVLVTSTFREASHSLNLLPPARGRTFEAIVSKQAVKMTAGKPPVFRYQILGKEGEQNLVHIVAVPRSDLEWLGGKIRQVTSLYPSAILTYPVAVSLLLKKLGHFVKDEPVAFMEVRGNEVFLVIYRGEGVAVFRKIALETAPGAEWTDTSAWNRLSQEIFQTFLYFRQRFHGVEVTRLVIAGDRPSDDILAHMRAVLGVQMEDLRFTHDLPFPREILTKYPSLVGLYLTPPRYALTFTVPSFEEERSRHLTFTLSWTLIFAALAIYFGGFSYFTSLRTSLEEFNREKENEKSRLEAEKALLTEYTSILDIAEGFGKLQEQTKEIQPLWSQIFAELQAVTPPGVHLQTLTIKRDSEGWAGTLNGSSQDASYERNVRLVNALGFRMALSPYFSHLTVTKQNPSFKEGEVTLPFVISFRVESFRAGGGGQ